MTRSLPAILVVLGLAAIAALPLFVDSYVLRLGTIFAMYAVLAQSWNIIGGFAGYPSFSTAAFFGLGAYTSALLQQAGIFMPLAWMGACIFVALFAACLGLILLHLKGHYFAIASLVIANVLVEIATSWTSLTGGGMGLNLTVLQISVDAQAQLFFWAMLTLSIFALIMNWIVAGQRLGFGLRCIKQNEDAAAMIGLNTTLYKVVAFMLSAVFVGGAGGIYASWVFYIEPSDVFNVLLSIKPIVMVMLGGAGTVLGPIIGAGAFLLMEETVWRNFLDVHAAVLGLLIVALIFFLPRGILGLLTAKARAREQRKLPVFIAGKPA